MNLPRILLLILLAVLLPVRGALAAAMPCAGMAAPATTVQPASADDAVDDACEHAQAAPAAAAEAPPPAHQGGMPAKCSLCAVLCAMTPMPAAAPSIAVSERVVAITFAGLEAPPARFLAEGAERPPRST